MPHADQDLVRLRKAAAASGGVVSAEDLGRCGVSTRAAVRRVESGDWSRIGRAFVLAPEGRRLSDHAWCHILRITYGERARISGHLAMRHAGWTLPGESRVVVIPYQPKSAIPGVMVLRRADSPAVRGPDGLRFTRRVEALLDSLVVLGSGAAEDLLDAALQKRLITPAEFEVAAMSRRGRGKRGAELLAGLVERAMTGSRSEAEQRMAALLKRSRTGPWVPNHPVRDASGRIVAEIDFAHEGLRIAIEVDGRAHHSDRRSFERDRERQNHLVLQGWLILRFTWEQITQRPQEVIAAVLAAVAQRAA
jgi:hypothetical protein